MTEFPDTLFPNHIHGLSEKKPGKIIDINETVAAEVGQIKQGK